MHELNIPATDDTPAVRFDVIHGIFEISGKSMPEDVAKFYNPIIRWLESTVNIKLTQLEVHFRFKYFNTSSSKMILELLKRIQLIKNSGKEVVINWYYLKIDEDMLEEGRNFSDMVDVPFKFVEL